MGKKKFFNSVKGIITMQSILITLLFVALLVVVLMSFVSFGTQSYNVELDKQIDPSYNNTGQEIINLSGAMFKRFESNTTYSSSTGIDDLAIGSYNVLRLFMGSFGIISKLINVIAMDLGVPPFVIPLFLGVVCVIIIGIILVAIIRPSGGV